MLGTTMLLWILFLFNPKKEKIQKLHYKRFAICMILGIVVNQLLFIKGLSLTYSIHASLLMLTTPIFITIIAAWLLKESINANKIIGLILGLSGAATLILARHNSGNGMNVVLGDIFVVINAICYSYYFVLVKPLMKRYNPITVIRTLFTYGTICALPFCWTEFSSTPWQHFTTEAFFILGLIVFGGTFCAYLFNLYGIKHLGPSVSGAYIYSQPLFASIIAMIFLGESFEIYKVIGAILIFSGVFLANKTKPNQIETEDV